MTVLSFFFIWLNSGFLWLSVRSLIKRWWSIVIHVSGIEIVNVQRWSLRDCNGKVFVRRCLRRVLVLLEVGAVLVEQISHRRCLVTLQASQAMNGSSVFQIFQRWLKCTNNTKLQHKIFGFVSIFQQCLFSSFSCFHVFSSLVGFFSKLQTSKLFLVKKIS